MHIWLLPFHQDVIPHMAQEYGFEYELVTYKWPTWLHKQKEKQRIIWAYKILFLDVIFPLSLEKVLVSLGLGIWLCFSLFILLYCNPECDGFVLKIYPYAILQVIFVDADQVVRTDMGELYDMDIKGRPLAYTPFCDNNKDMDGYRFWRQVNTNNLLFYFIFLPFWFVLCHWFSLDVMFCKYSFARSCFLLIFVMEQGFWKEHLRGRPYHIRYIAAISCIISYLLDFQGAFGLNYAVFSSCSALYVVDLKKFRQTAAGDNLRVFYETLSKDPNSLANLDQVCHQVGMWHVLFRLQFTFSAF